MRDDEERNEIESTTMDSKLDATRVAVVTGASRGIGAAVTERLVKRGWTVVAISRSVTGAAADPESSARLSPGRLVPVALDVTDEDSIRPAVERIEREIGPIDLLVNNAGYGLRGSIEDVSVGSIRSAFEVNVFALIAMTQAVLPAMRGRRRGRIVNISSVQGEVVIPVSGVYGASKFAVEAVSDALRMELQPWSIDVVLVQPGPVKTGFAKSAKEVSASYVSNESSAYAPR